MSRKERDLKIIDQVIEACGGVEKTQKHFKYSNPTAIYNWRTRGLPRHLIADIYLKTGIPIKRLKRGIGPPGEISG